MLDFYNAYKEKILQFILYRFQRSIGITVISKINGYYFVLKENRFLKFMRKYIYPVVVVLASLVAYFSKNTNDLEKVLQQVRKDTPKQVTSDHPHPDTENSSYNSSIFYLPKGTPNSSLVKHSYYTLSYNEKHEQPNWVAYHLKKSHLKYNDFKRPYFEQDTKVKTQSAHWKNYKKSGYDRGHLCPAADRRFQKSAYDQTFLTSNVSPQIHEFNAGIWNELEQKVRYWVGKEQELYIICGPVFENTTKNIGFEEVTVPSHFFKIIYKPDGKSVKMTAFLIPHKKNLSEDLDNYVVTIDALEKRLGFDFFSELPDSIENQLEAQPKINWKL